MRVEMFIKSFVCFVLAVAFSPLAAAQTLPNDIIDYSDGTADVRIPLTLPQTASEVTKWRVLNSVFRTLTIVVNSDAAIPASDFAAPFTVDIRNVTCMNTVSNTTVDTCVSIEIAESARLRSFNLGVNSINSPSAVAVAVNGVVELSSIGISNVSGCVREGGSSCVAFGVSLTGSFSESAFAVTNSTVAYDSDVVSNVPTPFLMYDIFGVTTGSYFSHAFLIFSTIQWNVQPVNIAGRIGTISSRMNWSFLSLEKITLNLTGTIRQSVFAVTNSFTSTDADTVYLNIDFFNCKVNILSNRYSYCRFGSADKLAIVENTDLRVTKASLATSQYMKVQIGIAFYTDIRDKSTVIVDGIPDFDFAGLNLYWYGSVGSSSSVTVSNSHVETIFLAVAFSDDCTTAASCAFMIKGNNASMIYIGDNTNITRGAYLLIEKNAGRSGALTTTFQKGVSGTGVVSIIDNNQIAKIAFGGFEGYFELWDSVAATTAAGNNSMEFAALPLPKRVSFSWLNQPLLLKGALLESNETSKAVFSVLDYGCADVYDTTSASPNTPINGTVACARPNIVKRCDEGLSLYYPNSQLGFREEFVMREHVEACIDPQRDVPHPTPSKDNGDDEDAKHRKIVISAVLISAAVVIVAGYVSYVVFRRRNVPDTNESLMSMAQEKADYGVNAK